MEIRKIENHGDLEVVFPIIKELRPHLSFTNYTFLISEASKRDEYEIVAAYNSDHCIGAMGFRVLFDFVHGKHLYIDDLVVTKSFRSKGIGAHLLKYAEQIAMERKCKGLRLCTGIENKDAKKFYEREGWRLRSVTYKKIL